MLRVLFALFIAFLTAPAVLAECGRVNLLDRMAPAERAALDARVAGDPFAEGNHWVATRGEDRIDIIGTFHIYDDRMPPIVERLAPVVARADALWLEATEADMRRLQSEMARNPMLIFSKGPTLPERLDEADWQALSAALARRGFPPFLASKLRPWFAAMLLSMPTCTLDTLGQPREGFDALIRAEAEKAGVPVMGLEPWDTVLKVFDAMEQTDQIEQLRLALLISGQSDDFYSTAVATYFDQKHGLIWEMSRDLNRLASDPASAERDFALMAKVLLTDRNRAWADRVDTETKGKDIVVAVGAAHLSGSEGVLALLKSRGWTLQRAGF